MRIKSIRLKDFRRFTDLNITGIPESSRLVVLIGPNGVGKSSVFEGFLVKSQERRGNFRLDADRQWYYDKALDGAVPSQSTHEVTKRVTIEMHSSADQQMDWSRSFCIRTAYRHQADFRVDTVNRVMPAHEQTRFGRIIDGDAAVADDYSRLVWKLFAEQFTDKYKHFVIQDYHRELLQEIQDAVEDLFASPHLELQDFGGPDEMGSFRFSKGTARDFHYKNLSGGEKAAFDLLLDLFIKRDDYPEGIFCIDEPEAHVAPALHGRLLNAMMGLVSPNSQLWIATHSIGFVRGAFERMKEHGDVAFLDFSDYDFDQQSTVHMAPRIPDTSFWRRTYRVTLDDLADLIAPASVVLCEGAGGSDSLGFDAECYTKIFDESHPETLFVGRGGSKDVQNSERLVELIALIAKGINVWRLVDRDEMPDGGREHQVAQGIRVLRRRELENYLYDPLVLCSFLDMRGKAELSGEVIKFVGDLIPPERFEMEDIKVHTQKILQFLKKESQLPGLGNSRQDFARWHLVPALKRTPQVLKELEEDVFPQVTD